MKFKKYCPNVFLIESNKKLEKGEIVEVETKYGDIREVIIYNLIYEKDGFFYYSQIRADGFNVQERAKRKAEKYQNWALGAERKSVNEYEKSNEGKEWLTLGEPIKVGHHSERRHRALIERNNARMSKSVDYSKKAEYHAEKAQGWEKHINDINLSMPESVEYFTEKLEKAKTRHAGLKNGTIEREHSYSLTYANKDVKDLTKKKALAEKLWC